MLTILKEKCGMLIIKITLKIIHKHGNVTFYSWKIVCNKKVVFQAFLIETMRRSNYLQFLN